jgi:hypothetical protein
MARSGLVLRNPLEAGRAAFYRESLKAENWIDFVIGGILEITCTPRAA